MDKIKYFNIFELPEKQLSSPGKEIYEWEYLDEQGELKKDKKNIQEEIQSYLTRVDYKTQIAKGEMELNDVTGTHQDFTGIPNDTVAIYDYLNTIANLPQEQVAQLLEQVNAGNKESIQGKQDSDTKATAGGQVTQKDVQSEPTDAKIDTVITGKGKGEQK